MCVHIVHNDAVAEFVSEAKLLATEAAAEETDKQNVSIPNSIASLNELCDILLNCQNQPSTPIPTSATATTTTTTITTTPSARPAPVNTPSSSTVTVPT